MPFAETPDATAPVRVVSNALLGTYADHNSERTSVDSSGPQLRKQYCFVIRHNNARGWDVNIFVPNGLQASQLDFSPGYAPEMTSSTAFK